MASPTQARENCRLACREPELTKLSLNDGVSLDPGGKAKRRHRFSDYAKPRYQLFE